MSKLESKAVHVNGLDNVVIHLRELRTALDALGMKGGNLVVEIPLEEGRRAVANVNLEYPETSYTNDFEIKIKIKESSD